MPEVLSVKNLGVAFRERTVLAGVSLEVPATGVFVLLGPAGGGKSTLLRTLAGLNEAQPGLRRCGEVHYRGAPLGEGNRPALVQQDLKLFVSTVRENLVSAFVDRHALTRALQRQRLEHLLRSAGAPEFLEVLDDDALTLAAPQRRLLGVLRAMATDAALVCLDEPTAGLDDALAERVLSLVRWYAIDHGVLVVTHHQGHARALGGTVGLLAGGVIQHSAPSEVFFAGATPVTRHFLDTGGLPLPSPGADPSTLEAGASPAPALEARPATVGPRGFAWLLPGALGGLPRPGIVTALEEDLEGLRRLRVTTLVTLEETPTVPVAQLEAAGLESIHFPVVDMEAPEVAAAAPLCARIETRVREGGVVAFHCRAGHGRTGTLLACQLIWSGVSALEALERARGANPRWVTSDVQVRFLATFANALEQWGRGPSMWLSSPPAFPKGVTDVS